MKTSRLRSNFSRKHTIRAKPRKTKRRSRFRRKKTRYIMRGGANAPGGINFKKINEYDVYGNPVEEVSYSTPMQWDD